MDGLDPFLANLNPMIRYLDYHAHGGHGLPHQPAGRPRRQLLPRSRASRDPRHLSRQLSIYISPESLSIYPERLDTNRGNGYLLPFAIGNRFSASQGEVFPSFDCDNTSDFAGRRIGQRRARQRPGLERPALEPAAAEGVVVPALLAARTPQTPPRSRSPRRCAACTISRRTSPEQLGGDRALQPRRIACGGGLPARRWSRPPACRRLSRPE